MKLFSIAFVFVAIFIILFIIIRLIKKRFNKNNITSPLYKFNYGSDNKFEELRSIFEDDIINDDFRNFSGNNKKQLEKLEGKGLEKNKPIKKSRIKEEFNENGNLIFVCNLDDFGRQNGEYTMYYDNGKIMSKGLYKNNYLEGNITNYFENGNISMISNYVNGLQEGKVLLYYESGELESINYYSRNILQRAEVYAKNGNRIL